MQVAYILTDGCTVRSEIKGWTFEDSSLLVRKDKEGRIAKKIFIGHTRAPITIPFYGTILEMLADGWALLSPPIGTKVGDGWDWWLTRDEKEGLR